jgi:hypothetical protein
MPFTGLRTEHSFRVSLFCDLRTTNAELRGPRFRGILNIRVHAQECTPLLPGWAGSGMQSRSPFRSRSISLPEGLKYAEAHFHRR